MFGSRVGFSGPVELMALFLAEPNTIAILEKTMREELYSRNVKYFLSAIVRNGSLWDLGFKGKKKESPRSPVQWTKPIVNPSLSVTVDHELLVVNDPWLCSQRHAEPWNIFQLPDNASHKAWQVCARPTCSLPNSPDLPEFFGYQGRANLLYTGIILYGSQIENLNFDFISLSIFSVALALNGEL